jgi:hypothetical protein
VVSFGHCRAPLHRLGEFAVRATGKQSTRRYNFGDRGDDGLNLSHEYAGLVVSPDLQASCVESVPALHHTLHHGKFSFFTPFAIDGEEERLAPSGILAVSSRNPTPQQTGGTKRTSPTLGPRKKDGHMMPGSITAIDILMEPDATMVQHAEAVNARLLKVFPKGFSLDETHRPHLTTVQRFVQTANLEELYEGAERIIADASPADWVLKAFKYYYLPSNELGGAGIVVHPNEAWIKMQKELLETVAPFSVKTGTQDAFYTMPGEPELVSGMVEYIEAYASEHSGKNFMPHVTVGIAPREYLDKMLAEPFDEFTFSLAGASVYQLGDYGTARKRLKSWTFR